jgi:hypothetical protein
MNAGARDLGQRPAAGCARCGRLVRRKLDQRQQQQRQQRHPDQRDVGAGKRHAEQLAGGIRQIRPGKRTDDAAGQHQRDRALLERGCGQLGRGKAVQVGVGVVEASDHRGRHQQPEAAAQRRRRAQRGREHRHQQAELERALAAQPRLCARDQRRAERTADDITHHRQGRHPRKRRQRQADQPVDGDEGDVVGQEQPLAQGEQPQVAVHR